MGGVLDMGHARALLPLAGAEQVLLAQQVVQQQLSVRETERLAQQKQAVAENLQKSGENPRKDSHSAPPGPDVRRLEELLSDAVAAPVQIRANRRGQGQLCIRFSSLDQLDGILRQFRNYDGI